MMSKGRNRTSFGFGCESGYDKDRRGLSAMIVRRMVLNAPLRVVLFNEVERVLFDPRERLYRYEVRNNGTWLLYREGESLPYLLDFKPAAGCWARIAERFTVLCMSDYDAKRESPRIGQPLIGEAGLRLEPDPWRPILKGRSLG